MKQETQALVQSIRARGEGYRPIPFWSWNDKLEPEVLAWQIEEMAKQGLGGYFMHARGGLETKYLSEDWFKCIETGIKEGKRQGLAPWVYDEEGWPSGFAGGEVTAKGDRYYARGLAWKELKSFDEAGGIQDLLGVWQVGEDGCCQPAKAGDNGKLVAVWHTSCPFYIDILNPEVTADFIRCTHERYYERYKEEFGTGLKGFFTDEPRLSEGDVPWSYLLPEEFSVRYGYDLTACLPALFLPVQGYEQVRSDFWAMVSDLFVKNYMKQLYDWCTAHDCELTGHMMMEESLFSQMTGTSGSMPFYEFMHMPGVDWLRRTIRNSVVAKQVGSVADQLGKQKVITESFALCGWDVSFQELRRIVEWQFVNGVNVLCQHLEGYSLRGLRKRDYPPSMFYQQTWWDEYKSFNDYLAHLGAALTEGNKRVDVLVLHPMHSAWIAYDGTHNDVIRKLDDDFEAAADAVAAVHTDFHFGDETILQEHGSVENGFLKVGKCAYKAVVMPSMLTISASTLELLLHFAAQGGVILSLGDFPKFVDGRLDSRLDALKEKAVSVSGQEELAEQLQKAGCDCLSVAQNGVGIRDIHICQRDTQAGRLVYLVNHGEHSAYSARVCIPGEWTVSRLDGETLEVAPVAAVYENGATCLDLHFHAMDSQLLLLQPGKAAQESALQEAVRFTAGKTPWAVKSMDSNSLTLDACEYCIDDGAWEPETPVIRLLGRLLDRREPCRIRMRFRFEIAQEFRFGGEFRLAMETPEKFAVTLNGKEIPKTDLGWWKDRSFRLLDAKEFVQAGENTLELDGQFYQSPHVYETLYNEGVYETELNKLTYDTELESLYLVGDFGVYSKTPWTAMERHALHTMGGFVITNPPKAMEPGCLTQQGLAFFAGKLTLEKTVELHPEAGKRLIWKLEDCRFGMAKLFVNGQFVKKLLWAPFEADVTDLVKEGENTLTLELYVSNRNLLGPHHHAGGELYNVGPASFAGEWSWCDRPTEAEAYGQWEESDGDFWADGWSMTALQISE